MSNGSIKEHLQPTVEDPQSQHPFALNVPSSQAVLTNLCQLDKSTSSFPPPIQSVDCAVVVHELERIRRQYESTDDPLSELEGKISIYHALEFCLQAMRIIPEAGKPAFASYFAGEMGKELVDIQGCRRFVGRIRDILKDGVQGRFTIGNCAAFREKLMRLSKFSCFLTGQENTKARRYYDHEVDGDPTIEIEFLPTILFSCFSDKRRREDFWLLASQITGVAQLSERGKMKCQTTSVPNEYIYLQKQIALELSRFSIAILVEEEGKVPMQDTGGCLVAVVYESELFSNQQSLLHLPKSGSTLLAKRHSDPPSVILLDLHHLLYRLLHASEAGRAWMREPDWNQDYSEPPEIKTTQEMMEELAKIPPYVPKPEPVGAEQEIEFEVDKGKSKADQELEEEEKDYDKDYQVYLEREEREELDRKYTLKEAFETKMGKLPA